MCESEHLFPNNGIGRELVSLYKSGKISDRELLVYFCLFLFTGLDTLSNAVGNTLWFIGASAEVFQSLKTNPHLTQVAVDEIMRLWGPIRLCTRYIEGPLKLESMTIPTGSTVFVMIHAANRDGLHFPHPGRVQTRSAPEF